MKSGFTFTRTGDELVDRAFDAVARAFSNVDTPDALNVVTWSLGSDYRAVGSEDLIIVTRPVRVLLPTPSGRGWKVDVVATVSGVSIRPLASAIKLDGVGGGSTSLAAAYDSAGIETDGANYYTVGGTAAAPVIPPIPPFPPVVPPGPPIPPPPQAWFAPIVFNAPLVGDTSGTETWQAEQIIDFTGNPGSVVLSWWMQTLSSSGTGKFRVRLQDAATTSYKSIGGAVVIELDETSATFVGHSVSANVIGFVGLQRLTLTAQASASGQKAQIQGANGRIQ